MAKPKRHVVIEKNPAVMRLMIHCDRHVDQAAEVMSVEGVSGVTVWPNCLWVYVDPRYDLDEVAGEIEEMLTPVEVPAVFREAGAEGEG